MREIFIKHNPYKLETIVTVDNEAVAKNSTLNFGERRLQEWIENLPETLKKECNCREFNIKFHGTQLDFEDVQDVMEKAEKDGFQIVCEHIPAKEVKEKEEALKDIFSDIKAGPYEELREKDVTNAFEAAASEEFPVNVVATMSSGKSTVINALLAQKLMPAKQEACTATITEIHDDDARDHYVAEVFNSDGRVIEYIDDLNLSTMNKLNSDPNVSKIIASGDIPFVQSDEVKLVLVDTPGPNNARDKSHKAATYRMLSESSKTLVLYVLNATQLAINDDSDLLSYVAESMSVGGKQSRDRFIFILNKLDVFRKGEDSVQSAIDKTLEYLRDKGIDNPIIYPASALSALDIRTNLRNIDVSKPPSDEDDDAIHDAFRNMRKLNNNEDLHLENYSPMTPSMRGAISRILSSAKEVNDKKTEALVHSGIIPLEFAIRLYVEKYAKTAKIRNIVDTFKQKLEKQNTFENTRKDIAENCENKEKILQEINLIKRKIDDAQSAKDFKKIINNIDFTRNASDKSKKLVAEEIQSSIRTFVENDYSRLNYSEVTQLISQFIKKADNTQSKIQVKLEELIENLIRENTNALLNSFKERLSSFNASDSSVDINIDPFKLLNGDNLFADKDIDGLIINAAFTESVVVGQKWIENTSKKWYKPWTWFSESGHYVDVHEDREFYDGNKIIENEFNEIQTNLYQNADDAVAYARDCGNKVKDAFRIKFAELETQLQSMLTELENSLANQDAADKAIAISQKNLDWLTNIHNRLNAILEI